MRKYVKGLLYGRFQPFHNGHLYLIKKALTRVDSLVIGIGSTNITDQDNPFTYAERRIFLQKVIDNEKIARSINSIVDFPDVPNDDDWLALSLAKVRDIDVIIGNNEWTNDIFQRGGYPIITFPFFKRYILEGVKIRELLKLHGTWQKRVPSYLVEEIEKNFRGL